jgi:hypothetical protein
VSDREPPALDPAMAFAALVRHGCRVRARRGLARSGSFSNVRMSAGVGTVDPPDLGHEF